MSADYFMIISDIIKPHMIGIKYLSIFLVSFL